LNPEGLDDKGREEACDAHRSRPHAAKPSSPRPGAWSGDALPVHQTEIFQVKAIFLTSIRRLMVTAIATARPHALPASPPLG